MSDTDLEKTLSVPNDTSLTLFDGDGFIGINRPSVGIYVQRNRPQKATDSPLSGYEEVIHDLCDHIRILERKAAEAQSLCNRWMKTALDMAPGCTAGMVILPNNPEAFAMSRASVIHQLESQLSEASEAMGVQHQEARMSERLTLLPCPFCGGEPASYWIEGPYHSSRNNPDHFRIACCVSLEARTGVEAAGKWNRRAALSFVAGAAGEREAKPSEGAQRDAEPKLECPKCHADRFKEPCKLGSCAQINECPMVGKPLSRRPA